MLREIPLPKSWAGIFDTENMRLLGPDDGRNGRPTAQIGLAGSPRSYKTSLALELAEAWACAEAEDADLEQRPPREVIYISTIERRNDVRALFACLFGATAKPSFRIEAWNPGGAQLEPRQHVDAIQRQLIQLDPTVPFPALLIVDSAPWGLASHVPLCSRLFAIDLRSWANADGISTLLIAEPPVTGHQDSDSIPAMLNCDYAIQTYRRLVPVGSSPDMYSKGMPEYSTLNFALLQHARFALGTGEVCLQLLEGTGILPRERALHEGPPTATRPTRSHLGIVKPTDNNA